MVHLVGIDPVVVVCQHDTQESGPAVRVAQVGVVEVSAASGWQPVDDALIDMIPRCVRDPNGRGTDYV